MAFIDDLAAALSVRDMLTSDPATGRLPPSIEATLPTALGKGVANGMAALSASGQVVNAAGAAVAVIGTTAGTALDAAAGTTAINAAAAAASLAVTTASTASSNALAAQTAAGTATTTATTANTTAGTALTVSGSKIARVTGADVPAVAYYATMPTVAALTAAGVPIGTLIAVKAA